MLTPPGRRIRRGSALGFALIAVILGGPLSSCDGDGPAASGEDARASATVPLRALTPAVRAEGEARLVGRGAQARLGVRVRGLPAIDGAYQVWLYNSVSDAVAVARVVRGRFALEAALPADFAGYRLVDISREPLRGNPNHSGQSLLRASMARLRRAKRSS